MKNLLTIFFTVILNLNLYCVEKEKLPAVPWANIVEMHSRPETINGQWGVDVKIKLVGAYTSKDSLIIADVVQLLDSITQTISVCFSETERGNLEVFFINAENSENPGNYLAYSRNNKNEKIPENSNFISDAGRTYSRVIIEKDKISPIFYKQIIKNSIAKEIGGGYLTDGYFLAPDGTVKNIEALKIAKNRNSIFNKYENFEAHRQELNELDIAIIKATYQPDYKEKLKMAREQFNVDPWWLKVNPAVFLIFPIGILLLVFTYIVLSVYNKISGKISKSFWKLNFKILLGIIVIAFSTGTYSFFKDYWYHLAQGEINISLASFMPVQTYLIMFYFYSIFLFPVLNLLAYLEKIIKKYIANGLIRFLLIFTATFFIPLLLIVILNINSLNNSTQFSENDAIQNISTGFIIFLILAGFWVIISYFVSKEKDMVRENESKLSSLRELKTKAELNALHSRINPHFLYNSLNSIAGLAHENADKTEHMALSLSKLFRYSINKEKSDWTTFKEELEMIQIYLEVEKIRFDDRLTYSIHIPKELEEQKIPRFIIQPLVENAIKHGISKNIGGGKVLVNIDKKKKWLVINVTDTGESFPDDFTPGFGIQSIYDKLEILYKDRFEIYFTNTPIKHVTLKLDSNVTI